MANIFTKIFSFLKNLITRPGLDKFVGQWLTLATERALKLSAINNNEDFHFWKDSLFEDLKGLTGQARDNWIAILIHLAYEQLKGGAVKK